MAIRQETRRALYTRADGRCECEMTVCDHKGRCIYGLVPGYWEAHHKWASGPDSLNSLIAMCATCHKNTLLAASKVTNKELAAERKEE